MNLANQFDTQNIVSHYTVTLPSGVKRFFTLCKEHARIVKPKTPSLALASESDAATLPDADCGFCREVKLAGITTKDLETEEAYYWSVGQASPRWDTDRFLAIRAELQRRKERGY